MGGESGGGYQRALWLLRMRYGGLYLRGLSFREWLIIEIVWCVYWGEKTCLAGVRWVVGPDVKTGHEIQIISSQMDHGVVVLPSHPQQE